MLKSMLVVLLLALPLGLHATQVYKWVDEQGNLHFAETPPPSAEAEQLEINARQPTPDPQVQERRDKMRFLGEQMEREREQTQAQRAQKRAVREKREAACARERKRLYDYRHAGYLYRPGSGGEREILSHEERAKREAQLEAQIRQYCD